VKAALRIEGSARRQGGVRRRAEQIRAYVEAAENLIRAGEEYEKQRREFVEAHPRLVPREDGGSPVPAGAAPPRLMVKE
jgi:hypothetical protein